VIEAKFQQHRLAPIITSMPGFGSLLGAELLAATNGDLTSFTSADRLAGIAGLAPVPRDSGRITGNLKRPRRYDRRLLRVFYLAAINSIKTSPESRNEPSRDVRRLHFLGTVQGASRSPWIGKSGADLAFERCRGEHDWWVRVAVDPDFPLVLRARLGTWWWR
jgi:Transposase IS116/IS110/IS902 family